MSRAVHASLPLLAAALIAMPAQAKQKAEHLFGPPPTWEQFRRVAEADIAGRLVDPDSARISWLGGFYKGEFKPMLAARVTGYVACGTVNARNRMGGYAGASSFVVVIDYDRVLYAEIDERAGGLIGMACAKAQTNGLLPPVPASSAAFAGTSGMGDGQGTTANADAGTGLSLRAMPDGAYVSAVAPGSPAANAGLKPGMVIASVNAIPLSGMGDAMLKVVDAAGAGANLTIVGGSTIKLGAAAMTRRLLTATVALMLAGTGPALAREDIYGSPPDWTNYKELGEAALRAKLPEAGRWSIEWPNGYMRAGWRHKGRFPGYLSCGILRADTPVPGFYPVTQFVVVIDNDRVQTVDISTRERNSLVNVMCDALVARGKMPPAQLMERAHGDLSVSTLGLTIWPEPEGAYVVAVVPGSPGEHAGLTPGTVLTRANGLALAGLGQAMAAVLGSDAPTLTLDTAAGGHVEVRHARP